MIKFYKDIQWYLALAMGVLFWLAYPSFNRSEVDAQNESLINVLLFGVLVYPILEEIVFRGWLQGALLIKGRPYVKSILGISLANLITSVIFAALHLVYQDYIWALLIVFPSLVFGYFRDRYQKILPSIIIHSFYNCGFILLIDYY